MNVSQRIKGETPGFFKKIINIAITVGGLGGAILGLPVLFPTLILPALIVKIASGMIVAGTAGGFVAKNVVTPAAIEEHKAQEAEKKNESNIAQ